VKQLFVVHEPTSMPSGLPRCFVIP
jgi:hypothetical protein